MLTPEKKTWSEERLASGLLEAVVFAGAGLFLLAGLLVGGRHWSGALEKPLSTAALCGLGIGLSAVAAALRGLGLRLRATRQSPRRRLLLSLGLSAAILCFGLALTPPGTSAAGRAFFWFVLLAEETGSWAWIQRAQDDLKTEPAPIGRSAVPRGPSPFRAAKTGTVPLGRELPPFPGADTASEGIGLPRPAAAATQAAEEIPGHDVLQHLTRHQAADGEEEWVGWVRMPVAVGQRTGHVHVAFCPPLACVPELAVQQIEGPEARIRIAQLLPYGVRFDLKLSAAAAEPGSVLVYFFAKAPKERAPNSA
jgi:hypothetical protein